MDTTPERQSHRRGNLTPQRAEKLVYNCLARREHSQAELAEKLQRKGFASDVVDQVLAQLQETGLQSDERFTESFVRSRIGRGQGPVRIRHELKTRGIASELVELYLNSDDDFWREQAIQILSRRHNNKYANRLQPVEEALDVAGESLHGDVQPGEWGQSEVEKTGREKTGWEKTGWEKTGWDEAAHQRRQKQRASHARFLASRGFTSGTIAYAVKWVLEDKVETEVED